MSQLSEVEATDIRSPNSDTTAKIFISGIPRGYNKDQIRQHIQRLGYGNCVQKIQVFRNKQSLGSGLVTVSPKSVCRKVAHSLNGTTVDGNFEISARVQHKRNQHKKDKGSRTQVSESQVGDSKMVTSTLPSCPTHQRCNIISVENLPQFLTADEISSELMKLVEQFGCTEEHITVNELQRSAKLILSSEVDPHSVCREINGRVILVGEPVIAFVGEKTSQQEKSNPALSKKHQRRQNRRIKKSSNSDKSKEDEMSTSKNTPTSNSVDRTSKESVNKSQTGATNSKCCQRTKSKSVTTETFNTHLHPKSKHGSLHPPTDVCPPYHEVSHKGTSLGPLVDVNIEDGGMIDAQPQEVEEDSSEGQSDTGTARENACNEMMVRDSGDSSLIGENTVSQYAPQSSSKKGTPQPTVVVFHLHCHTSKDYFTNYLQYTLFQGSTAKQEFEVKEVKNDKSKSSEVCEVFVQFPSLSRAKSTLKRLKLKDPGLSGEVIKQEIPTIQNKLKTKVNAFKKSINDKSASFRLKHEAKCNRLKEEQKKQVVPKRSSVQTYQEVTARRKVLNQAIVECHRQQDEFTTYCRSLNVKIEGIEGQIRTTADKSEVVMDELRILQKNFGNECCRFERALPMYAYRSEIVNVMNHQDNQVVILIGETGSGKSTQLIQYLYECGLAMNGTIVCTQPRKVAAISLAKHVCIEMGVTLGQLLGYKTGLRGSYSDTTKILYLTDHTLLNECVVDPTLARYSCVIVDEAHERSLSTDLLLAFIKKCLPNRPDLKVIITSATIDPKIFDAYFGGGCPIIKVPGRTYPVDIVWNPLRSKTSPLARDYVSDCISMSCRLHETEPEPGDILVFLTSAAEIEKACQAVSKVLGSTALVLPLHGKLPPEEQQKVFEQGELRKIVFATNVAETSITIPGVKYIVDTGLAKELCFDPKKNMNSLEVRLISKSSAEQRKGRAGRTSAGKCYRLYSEEIYEEMPEKSVPEILRVSLETTALKLHEFGIADVLSFDYVEEPDRDALVKAVDSLEFLGAVKDGKLTDIGRKMAALPIDPHFSRILLDGIDWGIGLEATVSAAISTLAGSVFFRAGTDEMKDESDMKTIAFSHPAGDQMTYIHTYFQWAAQERAKQNEWCVEHFVNAKSMRMVREVVKEFRDILRTKFDIEFEERPLNLDIVEEVLPKLYFNTFIGNLCVHLGHDRVGYFNQNLPNERFFIFYGSPLRQLNVVPKVVVYEKTLVTSQHFLLQALPVKEEWIYEAIQSGKLPCHPAKTALYQKYCVYPIVANNLGRYTLNQLRKGQSSIEERIVSTSSDQINPEIDYDYKLGTLKAFVPCCHYDSVSLTVALCTSEIKAKLKGELCDKGITEESNDIRVVLKNGASITHVLMPDQYRRVIAKGPYVLEHKDELIAAFKHFGEVENVNIKQINKAHCLFVSYTNPDSASEAVDSIKTQIQLPDNVVVRPDVVRKPQDGMSTFKLHLEWCRRARKNYAIINFVNPEDFSIASQRLCFARHVVYVKNRYHNFIKFKISSKAENQLFVTNVALDITEDLIREALIPYLSEVDAKSYEVILGYEPQFETSDVKQRELEQELDKLISPYATRGKYRVYMNPSKKHFKTYRAQIKFDNPDEGYLALKHIKYGYIESKCLSVKPELSSVIRYSSKLYTAIESSVEEVSNEIHRRYEGVHVDHGKKDDNSKIIVRITAEDVEPFVLAKHALGSVMSPDVIDCSSAALREFIFTANCKKALEKIETETSTFIQVNKGRSKICIYGSESNRTRAKIKFNECLSFLDDGTKCYEIRLKAAGKPPGLMKYLVSQFGTGLQQLEERDGLTSVRLDPRQQVVTMFASQEMYESFMNTIDICSASLLIRIFFVQFTVTSPMKLNVAFVSL